MTQNISLAAALPERVRTISDNQGTNEAKHDIKNKCNKFCVLSVFLTISLIGNIGLFKKVISDTWALPPPTQSFCPDEWIGYQNNCYYFSKQEGNWNFSRLNCSTQHADLTVIDTKEEMNFLREHKCTSDHWIGLQMTENQTRKWVTETTSNEWLDVKGKGKCAYLGDDGAATARCYTERKWICRMKKALQLQEASEDSSIEQSERA